MPNFFQIQLLLHINIVRRAALKFKKILQLNNFHPLRQTYFFDISY
jgi:hypothetical protein